MMEKVKLKEHFISDIYFYQEGPGVRKTQFTDNGVKLLNVGNINNGRINLSSTKINISEEEANGRYSHFLVDEGDLLIACSGIVVENFHNKIAFASKENLPLCLNTSTMRFKQLPEKKGDLNYLKYFLQTILFKKQLTKLITGSAQLNFGPSHIRKIKIPLPDLPTQQKIARILDKADELRQYNKQLIEKYDALTQSLFLDMFGDPVKNEKQWEIKKMIEVCHKITDGTHFSPESTISGFPYVTAKHVKNYGLDFNSKPTFISEEAHNEIYKRCTPEFGDVLYIKDGATTGIACLNSFNEPISLLSSLALLKPNKLLINNYFLCYWLNNEKVKKKLISEFMSGAAIQRYTLTKINSFQITIPPIKLQNQFAERIQIIENQKQQAQESLEKSELLFQSLLQKSFK